MFNLGLNKKIDEVIAAIESFAKETDDRLKSLEIVSTKQEINLKEHMKRSDQLEELLNREGSKREKIEDKIEKHMEKSNRHISMIEGGLKFFGVFATLVAIVVGLFKLVDLI